MLPEFEDNQTLLGGLAESFSSGKKFWISLRDRVLDFTSFALIEHNRNIARRLFSLVKNVGKKLQITFDGSALRPLKRILRPFGVWLGRYLLALDVLKDTKKVDEEYLVGEGRKRPRWQAFWSIAARALILGARYLGGVAGIEGGKLLIEAWLGRILQRMLFVGLMADLAEGLFIVIIAAGGSYLFGYLARQLGYVINLVFYLTWALLRRLQIRIRPAKRRLKPGVSQTKHPPPKPPYREEIKKRPPWNPLPPPWFPDGGTPDDAYSDDEGGGGPSGSGVPISPTPGPVPTGMHPIPTPNGALPTAVIHNPPVTPAPVPLPHVAPPLPAPNIVLPKPQPLPHIAPPLPAPHPVPMAPAALPHVASPPPAPTPALAKPQPLPDTGPQLPSPHAVLPNPVPLPQMARPLPAPSTVLPKPQPFPHMLPSSPAPTPVVPKPVPLPHVAPPLLEPSTVVPKPQPLPHELPPSLEPSTVVPKPQPLPDEIPPSPEPSPGLPKPEPLPHELSPSPEPSTVVPKPQPLPHVFLLPPKPSIVVPEPLPLQQVKGVRLGKHLSPGAFSAADSAQAEINGKVKEKVLVNVRGQHTTRHEPSSGQRANTPPRIVESNDNNTVCISMKALCEKARSGSWAVHKDPALSSCYGLNFVLGYAIDEANRDIVLYGTSHQSRPSMHFDDLSVCVQNVWNPARSRFVGGQFPCPFCSLDPLPGAMAAVGLVTKDVDTASLRDPGNRDHLIKKLTQALGPQQIVIGGIAKNVRLAHVMIDADYHMKKVSQGLVAVSGVRSVSHQRRGAQGRPISIRSSIRKIFASGAPADGASTSRFWFHLDKNHPSFLVADGIVRVDKCAMIVLTERQVSAPDGTLQDGGGDDPNAQAFAAELSAQLRLGRVGVSEYEDLENLYRLFVTLKAIQFRRDDEMMSLNLNPILRCQPKRLQMPIALPALANVEVIVEERSNGTREQSSLVCGGVSLEISLAAKHFQRSKDRDFNNTRQLLLQSRPDRHAGFWRPR